MNAVGKQSMKRVRRSVKYICKNRTGGMDTYTQQIDLSVKKKEGKVGGEQLSFVFRGNLGEW